MVLGEDTSVNRTVDFALYCLVEVVDVILVLHDAVKKFRWDLRLQSSMVCQYRRQIVLVPALYYPQGSMRQTLEDLGFLLVAIRAPSWFLLPVVRTTEYCLNLVFRALGLCRGYDGVSETVRIRAGQIYTFLVFTDTSD